MRSNYKGYDKQVREYMRAIIAELEAADRIKEVDGVALDILAGYLQQWKQAQKEVKKYGILLPSDRGNMSKNPAIDVCNTALRQALAIMQDYGLTAMSRKKLKRGEVDDNDTSPLVDFLKK